MLELVFVIVIVGILSFVAASSFQRNTLREAADQVVSHIRYTQHLAMMDDKFVPNITLAPNGLQREVDYWYKGRWQIAFHNHTSGTICVSGGSTNWSYSVFSDGPGTSSPGYSGNPDVSELAINPLDSSKRMSGGYTTSSGIVSCDDPEATKEMNLGYKFGVQDIDFLGGCAISIDQQRIFFDNLGKPFYGSPRLLDDPYKNGTTSMLIASTCRIELCLSTCTSASSNDKITIAIEPETGYTHILPN